VKAPFISVVIPTYNRAEYVQCAIDSVLAQAGDRCEIIVVDDGSTDNTKEVLTKYRSSISYIYQDNAGVSAARNSGIRRATGAWLAFLDSDDEWLPNFPAAHLKALERHQGVVGSLMNVLNGRESDTRGTIFDDRGLSAEFRGNPYFLEERPLLKIVEYNLSPILQGSLFRRDVVLKTKGFNTALRIAEDFGFVGQMALQGPFLFGMQPVAKLLRRKESTKNLTCQLFSSGIYSRECLHTVYGGFAADSALTSVEKTRLRRIKSQNLRSLGNLYLRAGRKAEARCSYRNALRADPCFGSVARYFMSWLPEWFLIHTIRKGRQVQPGV
jgi:glycosyltransferase involved in cell wall biosynthesis